MAAAAAETMAGLLGVPRSGPKGWARPSAAVAAMADKLDEWRAMTRDAAAGATA